MIAFLVVFLEEDDAVLAFGGVEVSLRAPFFGSEHIDFGTVGLAAFGSVTMDGYKEVGLGLVGYVGAFLQLDKDIGTAGVFHGDLGVGGSDELSGAEGYLKGDVFFVDLTVGTLRSGVLAAVAGINNNNKLLRCRQADCHTEGSQQTEETAGEESVANQHDG